MRSWVRGQWIPFDADAISQFLGYPLVLEEGQECEYGQRRNRSDGFDEEAIAHLLCIPGQDFARTAAGRRVRIMRTNMTTLSYPNFVRGPVLDDMQLLFGPCEVLGTHH